MEPRELRVLKTPEEHAELIQQLVDAYSIAAKETEGMSHHEYVLYICRDHTYLGAGICKYAERVLDVSLYAKHNNGAVPDWIQEYIGKYSAPNYDMDLYWCPPNVKGRQFLLYRLKCLTQLAFIYPLLH